VFERVLQYYLRCAQAAHDLIQPCARGTGSLRTPTQPHSYSDAKGTRRAGRQGNNRPSTETGCGPVISYSNAARARPRAWNRARMRGAEKRSSRP
jgi:hypothetical protein